MSLDSAQPASIERAPLPRRRPRFADLPPIDLSPIRTEAAEQAVFRALRRSVEQLVTRREAVVDITPEDIASPLEALSEAVRRASREETFSIRNLPCPPTGRPLLKALRRELLANLGRTPEALSSTTVVQVFRAFDEVERVLDQSPAQHAFGRLSEPDGPALLVEVAHDMRSPLTSILFLVESLRKGQSGSINPVQERQLGLVYSAALGLSSLSSDVVELASGRDRLLDPEPVAFSLLEVLQAVRDIVQPMSEEKGLPVVITPPDVYARVGQPAALSRVLLNLTINALKFTESGRVEIVCKAVSRSRLEISVADTGRGIPASVLGSVFEAFRDNGVDECRFSNAGLGLSICRKLVNRMGGELKVQTEAGKGTRFHFELDLPPVMKI